MKTITTFLVAFFVLTVVGRAQPVVSYIIPDIGAKGMNTYVEIIGPSTGANNFASDGFYFNNPGDPVRVEPNSAADATSIVVGPLVVSWNGRMISTQIFVKPGSANGTVTLKVTTGSGSTTVPFEIVTPQILGVGGTISGGGILGNGGALGIRSKRGAMIVGDLTLASGNFTVSTSDPDGTPGNQAYLPFILISTGKITINANVSVNGGAPDAGVGGGGGGGQVCDGLTGSGGGNGGAGYTGGGAGGQNNALGSDAAKSPGTSSGVSGNSLNNAPGGMGAPACYENGAGGTGHPFGKGGELWCGSGNPNGLYGGGGGGGNNASGGGGGYGADGVNGSGSGVTNTRGKQHGNIFGVPVAGGSGGASGNPQGVPSACSGVGGGGGGAIAFYAYSSLGSNAAIDAKGGNGNSGSPGGGGGSGGYVALGAKVLGTPSTGGLGNLLGGTGSGGGNGSNGRARYDGFTTTPPVFSNTGSTYIGPTMDTLTSIQSSTFTVSGSRNSGDDIRVYMKNDLPTSAWTALAVPNYPSARTWSITITLPPGSVSSNYYLAAVQKVNSPQTGDMYKMDPSWVFSQSAANIVNVALIPKIRTSSTAVPVGALLCEPSYDDSTLIVYNDGDDVLNVTPGIIGVDAVHFSVLPPYNLPFSIPPGGSIRMKIRYAPLSGGNKSATLRLTNNDPRPGYNPTDVTITGQKPTITAYLQPNPDLDFGQVCLDSTRQLSVKVYYEGTEDTVKLNGIPIVRSPQFSIVQPTDPSYKLAMPKDSVTVTVQFKPNKSGVFIDSVNVNVGPCLIPLKFNIRGEGIETRVSLKGVLPSPIDTLLFKDVLINASQTRQLTISNFGNSTGTIRSIFITPPNAAFVLPAVIGKSLGSGKDTTVNVVFTPTTKDTVHGQICVVFGDLCPDTTCIPLEANVVSVLLRLSRNQLQIGSDTCQEPSPSVTDTFKLYNLGGVPVNVTGASSKNGLVTVSPSGSTPLIPGDFVNFNVTWNPGSSGTDQIIITTDASDPAQQTFTVDVSLRRDSSRITLLDRSGSTPVQPVDFGKVYKCTGAVADTVFLHNLGTVDETVRGDFERLPASGGAFTLKVLPPYSLPKEARMFRSSSSSILSHRASSTIRWC